MSYPLLNVFLTMMFFFVWALWIFLLVWIVMDIFRSHDLGGWGKAGWLALVVVLPYLGVFSYLIARGGSMSDRHARRAGAQAEATGTPADGSANHNGANELAKLADLRTRGVITDAEFQQGKANILS